MYIIYVYNMYTIVQLQYCFEISLIPLTLCSVSVTITFHWLYLRSRSIFLDVIKTDFQRTLPVTTDILIKNEIRSILIENKKNNISRRRVLFFHALDIFTP